MPRTRKLCRVVKSDDGYTMYNTISSKKGLCKSLGGKWCPETLTWRFPLTAASSAEALEEMYNSARWSVPTSAHRRGAAQKELWMNTLTATETIEHGMLPLCGSVHDDVVGYFTGPDDEISAIADRTGGRHFRPRPGVLIWINNFG
jgi:hypothetical protein